MQTTAVVFKFVQMLMLFVQCVNMVETPQMISVTNGRKASGGHSYKDHLGQCKAWTKMHDRLQAFGRANICELKAQEPMHACIQADCNSVSASAELTRQVDQVTNVQIALQ